MECVVAQVTIYWLSHYPTSVADAACANWRPPDYHARDQTGKYKEYNLWKGRKLGEHASLNVQMQFRLQASSCASCDRPDITDLPHTYCIWWCCHCCVAHMTD